MSGARPHNGVKRSRMTTEFLLSAEYLEESHIRAFADALNADQFFYENQDASSPNIPGTPLPTPTPQTRIQKVSALSDFAPVKLKVKRRRKKDKPHDKRSDWLFVLLRWPLLLLFTCVRISSSNLMGLGRGKKGILRKNLRASRTYKEWKDAAMTLDEYLHFHEWKKVDEDPLYDWRLVKRTFLGTKDLIESYFEELERALEFIRESIDLSIDEKKRFFKSANTNLGISALCLSGGASFGYYHVGVVKAFLDAELLPRVITGTSAGGLIAALVCTRTDEELKALLVPELANRITACEEPYSVWLKRLWKTGARFDSVLWARKVTFEFPGSVSGIHMRQCTFFTRGSMTFKEAYMRTGRILNISVIPADRHSPTKLLNYMTAPDTLIWTALLASAAVPGILNPVVLLQKLKDGSVVPWNWGSKFKDGSLRVDIPLQSLNLYFNVTNPVVSQVNPHVHLFFFAPRGSAGRPVAHRKGKGWRGNFLLSAGEQWLKHELSKNFKVIRDLELLPQLLGQDWSSVFLQRFEGAVTDPDPLELERMMHVGQSVTWPKLHMIENRAKIENQIYLGRQYVRKILRGTPQPVASTSNTDDQVPNSRISAINTSQLTSDPPMSVDTDAETAFRRKSPWFFKSGHDYEPLPPISGAATPSERQPHLSNRPSTLRRKRVSEIQSSSNGSKPLPQSSMPSNSLSGSLLSKLHARSFPNLTSPFTADSSPASKESSDIAEHWSSDSSSEDDLHIEDRRQLRYTASTVSLDPLDTNDGDI
ncbi:hypothetical protein H0H92_009071 [Tricholoma furcatifolium]|nr:hypothetical protein H0H92_009071 [Tricholoma furcatifolium]